MTKLLPRERKSRMTAEHQGGVAETRHNEVEYLALCNREFPAARRRAVMSVIPGLGQLRNGEITKGALFLIVTAANVGIMVAMAYSRAPMAAQLIYILLSVLFVGYAIREAYDRAVLIVRDQYQPSKYSFALPEAASGSYLAHAAMMIAMLIAVMFFIAPPPPVKQTVVIELAPPEKKPPAPARKEPKIDRPKPKAVVQKPAEVPKPVIKPVVQPPVVKHVEPPKPTPVAVAVKTNEPTPITAAPVAAPAAAPAQATAPAAGSGTSGGGQTGGTGQGGGDGGGGEVDMGPWLREMQKRIKKSWFPPKGTESVRIKVNFKVTKDGAVHRVKLLSSSGVSSADDAAIQAVQDASPLPNLPDGVGDEIDMNFTFDYNVFGKR